MGEKERKKLEEKERKRQEEEQKKAARKKEEEKEEEEKKAELEDEAKLKQSLFQRLFQRSQSRTEQEEADSTVDNLPPPIPPHAKTAGSSSAQLSEIDAAQLGDLEHIIEGNSLEGPADLQRLDSLVTEFTSQFPPEPSESIVKS